MLIEFEVCNFLSFKNSTLLSMETGERLRKYKKENTFEKQGYSLLKNIITFGANGSGKSNLFTAVRTLRNIVLNPTKDIDSKLLHFPFKLDSDSDREPTQFIIKFIAENKIYQYNLEYDREQIYSEKLLITRESGEEETYFSRNREEVSEIIPEHLNQYRSELRKNKLFLYDAQNRNDKECGRVFKWFKNNLVFENSNNNELFKILRQKEKKDLFIKLMHLADINIIDIEVEEEVVELPMELQELFTSVLSRMTEDREVELPQKRIRQDINSVYKKYDNSGNVVGRQRISYGMESSGTQKMMTLALIIIHSLDQERVIFMDEFDDSFHLNLTKSIMYLINSQANINQFVFTSHNLSLLDCRLRTDQIYFTEKKFNGETELYSLFDFKDVNGVSRNDITFLKRYLNGLFGALPDIELDGIEKMFNDWSDVKSGKAQRNGEI